MESQMSAIETSKMKPVVDANNPSELSNSPTEMHIGSQRRHENDGMGTLNLEQGLLAMEEAIGQLSSQLEQVDKLRSQNRFVTLISALRCLTKQPVFEAGAARELATCCSNDTRRRCEAGG